MTGLVLRLGPGERVMINGAVVVNGDRRTRISVVTPNSVILRQRDAIHPEEANTPVRRICYMAQLVLSGDADFDDMKPRLLRGIEQLSQAMTDPDSRAQLGFATEAVLAGQHYQILKSLRSLLPREARLLAATGGR